jgi:WD40 repeat protein
MSATCDSTDSTRPAVTEPHPHDRRPEAFDLDARILCFDSTWREALARGGSLPDPAGFLVDEHGQPLAGEPRRRLLVELVMIDMECRWRMAGRRDQPGGSPESAFPERPRVEDYLVHYPELSVAESPPVALVVNEYRVRCRWADRPSCGEFLARFGHRPELVAALAVVDKQLGQAHERASGGLRCRCPHCHELVVLPEHDDVVHLLCPACGSSFSLVGGNANAEPSGQPLRFGHFEFLERLGGGSFGVVWKARDSELDRIVAVKVAHRASHDAQAESLLVREARAAAGLRHAGIVTIHEISRQDDRTYVISDYIHGQTLEDWAAARRPTFRQSATLCQTIAVALHYAHEQGVVHRDLKPSNILIDAVDAPFITDFGLAKRSAAETTVAHDGKLLGTPAYMSPEQALGQSGDCGPHSDVYSLGVILFELLTGERPFRGDVAMILAQVIADEPPSPRKLNAHIPQDLATICLKCMEKEPKARYVTARELSLDLGRYLRGEPIVARPVGRWVRAWRWSRRNPLGVALAAVIAFSAFGVFAGGWWHIERLGDELAINEKLRQQGLQRERFLRRGEYNRDMRLAKQSLDEEKLGHAQHLLEKYLPAAGVEDQRDFVWHYLWRRSHPWQLSLEGHTEHVLAVAWSPDGARLATTSEDSTARVYDARDGRLIATLSGHAWEVNCAAFLNSNIVLTGDDGGDLRWWGVEQAREIKRVKAHKGNLFCLAISPDGKTIASGGEDGVLRLWDVATQSKKSEFGPHSDWVRAVAWLPDGLGMVTVDQKGPLRVWNPDAMLNKPIEVPLDLEKAFALGLHPGGRFAAAGGKDVVRIVDLETKKIVATLTEHKSWVKSAIFTRDGRTLYTAGHDGLVIEYDVTNVRHPLPRRRILAHSQQIFQAALSPDEARLATASWDRTAKVWQAPLADPRWERLGPLQGRIRGVAISPDLRTIAAATGKTLYVWDYPSRQLRKTFPRNPGEFTEVTMSPDARWLAASCVRSPGRLWRLSDLDQPPLLLGDPINYPTSVAFDPQMSRFAITEHDTPFVRLLSRPNGSFFGSLRLPTDSRSTNVRSFNEVGYSQSGRWLVGTALNPMCTAIVWDAATCREHMRLKDTDASSPAFSHNENWLAVAGTDYTIRLFDLEGRRPFQRLVGHEQNIDGLAFSPDDRLLVSVPRSGPLKVWDVERGEEILNLADAQLRYVFPVFSADGRTLVVGADNNDGTCEVLLLKAQR